MVKKVVCLLQFARGDNQRLKAKLNDVEGSSSNVWQVGVLEGIKQKALAHQDLLQTKSLARSTPTRLIQMVMEKCTELP